MAIKSASYAALNSASSLPSISVPLSMGKFNCQQRRSLHYSCGLRGNWEKCSVVRANVKKIEGASLHDHDKELVGTPYIPVYVGLPLGTINTENDLVDPHVLINWLRGLKSINVDGVMVNCWWGIVEAHAPKQYNWSGYKKLFQIVRDLNLKLQVVMSFHGCGENIGDDVHIPLPRWVMEVGSENPDIFFTDSEGRRNHECLTWGIDNERVLRDRTAIEVYFDYMQSFRIEFDEFFVDGVISETEIGLGPCGELRYPSHSTQHGWKYPGIGEFQCYDKYLMSSLKNTEEVTQIPIGVLIERRGFEMTRAPIDFYLEGRPPNNAGSYNSKPQETKFFLDRKTKFFSRDRDDYDSFYGRFFLKWYSKVLIDHGDLVLAWANIALKETPLTVKLPSIHWWCKTNCRAAELTAGFYTYTNREGYGPITTMLKTHATALKFTCADLQTSNQYKNFPEALGDPRGLLWQVLNAAWASDLPIASENALTCYDREGYNKLLEYATPFDNPDGKHLRAFTFLRLGTELMKTGNFMEFERFVKGMHGERVPDLR